MTAPIGRDVARRRRRWLLNYVWAAPLGCLPAVAVIWTQHGWLSGVLILTVWANVLVASWSRLSSYREGYWRGRGDMLDEHAQRMRRRPPAYFAQEDPWAPRRPAMTAADIRAMVAALHDMDRDR